MPPRDGERSANLSGLIPQLRMPGSELPLDTLTGLPGRSLFHAVLARALPGPRDGIALLSLSIEDVGSLREEHGAPIADSLLAAVAGRLRRSIRAGDVAARIRDMDFALLMAADDVAEAACAAQRVLDRLREPYEVSGNLIHVMVSIGIAYAAPDDAAAGLLERADIALARAREGGCNDWRIFRGGGGVDPETQGAMIADLHAALANGMVSIGYRPVVASGDCRLRSADAVLRWDHPKVGLIGSADFLPVINDPDAARLLVDWVIVEACREAARIAPTLPITVPLERGVVPDAALERVVLDAVARHAIAPGRLRLGAPHEIFLGRGGDDAPEAPLAVLGRLRARGVPIVLLDYAQEAGPLEALRDWPLDSVRTAASALDDLGTDIAAFTRVQALTGLAASLGIDCDAAGVESDEQLEAVRGFGFTAIVGPILGEAMSAVELAAHARSGKPLRKSPTLPPMPS